MTKKSQHQILTQHFESLHNNPPKPFNPQYNSGYAEVANSVTKNMEEDGYYDTHTREECAAERKRRIDQMLGDKPL